MSMVVQRSLFDYDVLDIETRIFVLDKAATIHARLKRTAEDIIAIGLDLIAVKERLGHGQFIPWLETEFDLTRQSAANFMRVAERFGQEECKTVLHLPIKIIYELASPSTPDEVIEMVETGEIPPTLPAIQEARQEIQLLNKSNEWYTPARYIEAARTVMNGIDLDPASCAEANQTIKATRYYNKAENGLLQPWYGNVWLNPPFSDESTSTGMAGARPGATALFVEKLLDEYREGNVKQAVLLVNAKHDIAWFIHLWQFLICFADHKVRFLRPDSTYESHIFGTCFIYIGSNEQGFIDHFSEFGTIAKRISLPKEESDCVMLG